MSLWGDVSPTLCDHPWSLILSPPSPPAQWPCPYGLTLPPTPGLSHLLSVALGFWAVGPRSLQGFFLQSCDISAFLSCLCKSRCELCALWVTDSRTPRGTKKEHHNFNQSRPNISIGFIIHLWRNSSKLFSFFTDIMNTCFSFPLGGWIKKISQNILSKCYNSWCICFPSSVSLLNLMQEKLYVKMMYFRKSLYRLNYFRNCCHTYLLLQIHPQNLVTIGNNHLPPLTWWQFGLFAAEQVFCPTWGHSCSCGHLGSSWGQMVQDCLTHLYGC